MEMNKRIRNWFGIGANGNSPGRLGKLPKEKMAKSLKDLKATELQIEVLGISEYGYVSLRIILADEDDNTIVYCDLDDKLAKHDKITITTLDRLFNITLS